MEMLQPEAAPGLLQPPARAGAANRVAGSCEEDEIPCTLTGHNIDVCTAKRRASLSV